MNKIQKKDKVLVISGKDKGKTAEVIRVIPKASSIVVAGVNVVKKAVKPSKKNPSGGIVEIEKPIDTSNVAFVCPSCGKPARVGLNVTKKGQKERVCKKCKQTVKES
jgi:large subunit ribosomal protein L24